jgi:hypothetical protein
MLEVFKKCQNNLRTKIIDTEVHWVDTPMATQIPPGMATSNSST